MSELPEARIAGTNDGRVLLRGICIALAIVISAALLEANLIGGAIILALVLGLWLHRRHVIAPRPPRPRVVTPLRTVREHASRARSLAILSITGTVFAAWFVATVSVEWSIVGMVAVCAGMACAFTA